MFAFNFIVGGMLFAGSLLEGCCILIIWWRGRDVMITWLLGGRLLIIWWRRSGVGMMLTGPLLGSNLMILLGVGVFTLESLKFLRTTTGGL